MACGFVNLAAAGVGALVCASVLAGAADTVGAVVFTFATVCGALTVVAVCVLVVITGAEVTGEGYEGAVIIGMLL